jgi:hypothetical protein
MEYRRIVVTALCRRVLSEDASTERGGYNQRVAKCESETSGDRLRLR